MGADMYCRLALLALPLLLAYAPFDHALAGPRSSSQPRSAHSGPRHVTSPRHHFRLADRSNGTYGSQLLHSKSEWRQARHSENIRRRFERPHRES